MSNIQYSMREQVNLINQAIHVMTCGNSVTVEELYDHFFYCGKSPW
jgi:hypothetical protein